MDLSWCIICDKRIEEEEELYCSNECRLKDQGMPTSLPTIKLPVIKPWMSKKTAKHVLYKVPSNQAYPWIPFYRKRHHLLPSRRCQPTVAGSPINANALLSI